MAALQIPAIPPFDPNGNQNTIASKWEKWKKSFGYFVSAAAVADDARKRSLLLHLMGQASQEIFDTLPDTGASFDEAINALNAHFSVKKNVPYERSVFHSTKQDTQESTEQYVTRLRQLTTHCEYGQSTNDQIRDQIIASCRSSKFRTKCLQEKNLTLEKLIEIGQSLELASHQSRQIEQQSTVSSESINFFRNNNYRPNYQASSRPSGTSQKSLYQQKQRVPPPPSTKKSYPQSHNNSHVNLQICGRCGAKNHNANDCRRSKGATCASCGKVGLFAIMCRTRSTTNSNNRNRQNGVNQITTDDHDNLIDEEDSDDDFVFHVNATSDGHTTQLKANPPLYPIRVNRTVFNILIDSGASVNVLDKPTFDLMDSKPHLEATKMKIYSFQSTNPLITRGKFYANISLPNSQVTTKALFVVVEGEGGSLLSRHTAEQLDILRVGPPHSPPEINCVNFNTSTSQILNKHANIFKGHGCMDPFISFQFV